MSIYHEFRVFTENGVTIAENSGGSRYQQQLFEITEVVRLVQDENDPETLFYRVYDYRLADDGRYYVLDSGHNHIAVFGGEGNHLYTFGKDGRGPGEFDDPILRWVNNDHLVIDDDNLYRLSLWKTDGTLVRMINNPTSSMNIWDMYLTNDHQVVIKTREYERNPDGSSSHYYICTAYTLEGDQLGTVQSVSNTTPAPIRAGGVTVVSSGRGAYYAPMAEMDYSPVFGILSHNSEEPDLKWYDLGGNLSRVVRLGFEREPVTEEDRRQVLRTLQIGIDATEDSRRKAVEKARKEQARFSEFKALWGDIYIDDFGYCWLKELSQYLPRAERTGLERYMVVSPEGEYLGDMILPDSMVSICQGCVLTIQENEETGVDELIVYRLNPLVRGLRYPE